MNARNLPCLSLVLAAGVSGCQLLVPVAECSPDASCESEPPALPVQSFAPAPDAGRQNPSEPDAGRQVPDAGVLGGPDAGRLEVGEFDAGAGDGGLDASVPLPGGRCVDAGTCTVPWAMLPPWQLSSTVSPPGLAAMAMVVAHLDEDCAADVATVDSIAVHVYLTRAGHLTAPRDYGVNSGAREIAAGDFNRDGVDDLVLTHGGFRSTTISLLLSGDAGVYLPALSRSAGGSPHRLAVADFNRDGAPDFAATDVSDGRVLIYLGNGTGGFSGPGALAPALPFVTGSDAETLVATDLNQDLIPDLVLNLHRAVATGVVTWLGHGDGTFGAPTVNAANGDMSVGDFNLDGKPDLFMHNSVQPGRGDGTFAPPYFIKNVIGGPNTVGDLNGDCIPDVVFHNSAAAITLIGKGDGDFVDYTSVVLVPPGPMATGDLDCDGRDELLVLPFAQGPLVLSSTCH